MATFALIPAAGSGTRLAAGSPKQYLSLAGRPMLWHAIRALCVPQVAAVFVVLGAKDEQFAREDWSAFEGKLNPLYCGGETRRDSVLNGLIAVRGTVEADDWVLVHDAARPCLPRTDLQRLLEEGGADAIGAILALPVADTVRSAGKDEAGVQRIAARRRSCSAPGCWRRRCRRHPARPMRPLRSKRWACVRGWCSGAGKISR